MNSLIKIYLMIALFNLLNLALARPNNVLNSLEIFQDSSSKSTASTVDFNDMEDQIQFIYVVTIINLCLIGCGYVCGVFSGCVQFCRKKDAIMKD